jgi:hypothetical protein
VGRLEEEDGNVKGSGNHDQIFVSKGVKQAALKQACKGFKPSEAASVAAFCWQQVGLDRLEKNGGSSDKGDPTLNIDPSRNGVEPDIAFTGANDTVAWVTWYEKDSSNLGLRNNEQVFAARIVADPKADGGFSWRAVGSHTNGQDNILDTPRGIRLTKAHGHGHGKRASLIDARVPLSSSCTADPFTKDGAGCTAGDLHAPFYTFHDRGLAQRLFAQAATEGPKCVSFAGAVSTSSSSTSRRSGACRSATTARVTCACAGTCASTASRSTRAATA